VKARRAACSPPVPGLLACIAPARRLAALRRRTPGGPGAAWPARRGGKLRRRAMLTAGSEGIRTSRALAPAAQLLACSSRTLPAASGGEGTWAATRRAAMTRIKPIRVMRNLQGVARSPLSGPCARCRGRPARARLRRPQGSTGR
jgi:hypothetical protein